MYVIMQVYIYKYAIIHVQCRPMSLCIFDCAYIYVNNYMPVTKDVFMAICFHVYSTCLCSCMCTCEYVCVCVFVYFICMYVSMWLLCTFVYLCILVSSCDFYSSLINASITS